MASDRDGVKAEICRTLQHFRFPELKEMIDTLLPDLLSIPDVLKELKKAKHKFTRKTFAEMALMQCQHLSNGELRRLSHCIHLFDKAYHTGKTNWTCIELLEKTDNRINADSSIDSVSGAILQNIRINKQNAWVEVMKHTNNFFYILIQERKIIKGRKVSVRSPIFCACDLNEPYLFFSPKSASHNIILEKVATSLGYEDVKLCSLDGKNIASLTQILKNRFKHHTIEEYNPVDLVRTTDGLNYCQDAERIKYAAKVFGGDNPIELEALTVTSSVPFRGLRMLPEMEGKIFTSSLKLAAPNIAEFVKNMAAAGAIKPPFPSWLNKVPHLGKNSFEISQKPQ